MELQNSGMLSRDQLLFLFDRFASLTSLPGKLSLSLSPQNLNCISFSALAENRFSVSGIPSEVKKRIADAVSDKQVNRIKPSCCLKLLR